MEENSFFLGKADTITFTIIIASMLIFSGVYLTTVLSFVIVFYIKNNNRGIIYDVCVIGFYVTCISGRIGCDCKVYFLNQRKCYA